MNSSHLITLTIASLLFLCQTACKTYKAAPIDLAAEGAAWRANSANIMRGKLTLEQARALCLMMNPSLNVARAKHTTDLATATATGYWKDPESTGSWQRTLGADRVRYLGEAGLNFTIPLTALPSVERKIAQSYSEESFWSIRAQEAATLCKLEQAWLTLGILQQMQASTTQQSQQLGEAIDNMRTLAGVGELSPIYVQTAADAHSEAKRTLQNQTLTIAKLRAEIAQLLGVDATALARTTLIHTQQASLQAHAPSETDLAGAPQILAQLAKYNTSELSYRAAILRQYPDLNIGIIYTKDIDTKNLGIARESSIPLWNANRKEIAETKGERGEARAETLALWMTLRNLAHANMAQQKVLVSQIAAEQARLAADTQANTQLNALLAAGETTLQDVTDASMKHFRTTAALLELKQTLLQLQTQLHYLSFE